MHREKAGCRPVPQEGSLLKAAFLRQPDGNINDLAVGTDPDRHGKIPCPGRNNSMSFSELHMTVEVLRSVGILCKKGHREKLSFMSMAAQHQIGLLAYGLTDSLRVMIHYDDGLAGIRLFHKTVKRRSQIRIACEPGSSDDVHLRQLPRLIVQERNAGFLKKGPETLIIRGRVMIPQYREHTVAGFDLAKQGADPVKLLRICQNRVVNIQNISGQEDNIRPDPVNDINGLSDMPGIGKYPEMQIT